MSTMRIPKYTAGMFKKKMPRFGASSIKMPRIPKPPKPRVKKFDEGGDVPGYEEDPQPGTQSDKKSAAKKRSGTTSPRRVSSMEFIRKYEDSPASSRIQEEASVSARKPKQNLPGDRSTGFSEQQGAAKSPYVDLDQERADEAIRRMGDAALYANAAVVGREMAAKMATDIAKGVRRINLPLRYKQMMRRRETARINEMERAADKAGEAARRGMSRRGTPRYDERYRASEEGAKRREEFFDSFRKGGKVKSSCCRGDGIAKRGKTRGKFV